jgi:hypothetical protein
VLREYTPDPGRALSGIEMSPHCYTMWFHSGTNFTRYLSEQQLTVIESTRAARRAGHSTLPQRQAAGFTPTAIIVAGSWG